MSDNWQAINGYDGCYILYSGSIAGLVKPEITRNYSWSVYALTGGFVYEYGHAPDHISAMQQAEKALGLK